MKITYEQLDEIFQMGFHAQTGDVLAVYTPTFYGYFIRRLLTKGLKRCHTNHNAPVFGLIPRMLQIEPPAAHIEWLNDYLVDLYRKGGRAILLRPDSFEHGISSDSRMWLQQEWEQMNGTKYDNRTIRMFLRQIYRKGAKLATNTKETIICTEGTVLPLLCNIFQPWRPDVLKNEAYAAPIHIEHCIRHDRLRYVAGNRDLYQKILAA